MNFTRLFALYSLNIYGLFWFCFIQFEWIEVFRSIRITAPYLHAIISVAKPLADMCVIMLPSILLGFISSVFAAYCLHKMSKSSRRLTVDITKELIQQKSSGENVFSKDTLDQCSSETLENLKRIRSELMVYGTLDYTATCSSAHLVYKGCVTIIKVRPKKGGEPMVLLYFVRINSGSYSIASITHLRMNSTSELFTATIAPVTPTVLQK